MIDNMMQKIKVHIDWMDNYGAGSDDLPGCVTTHKSLDSVKKDQS